MPFQENRNGTLKQEFVLYYFDGISVPVASFADRITSYPEPFKIKEAIEKIKMEKNSDLIKQVV